MAKKTPVDPLLVAGENVAAAIGTFIDWLEVLPEPDQKKFGRFCYDVHVWAKGTNQTAQQLKSDYLKFPATHDPEYVRIPGVDCAESEIAA